MDIYVLFRDMRTYGFREDYYREAASKDVRFIRYEPEDGRWSRRPRRRGAASLRVDGDRSHPRHGTRLDADIVVLSAAVVRPPASQEIARLFKVALGPDGFFQEAHVKLRPVDFAADGVFLCGTAHYPKHISETISQAYGAAGRASTLLSQDTVVASGSVCEVDEKRCVACGACISVCTYGAIELHETRQGESRGQPRPLQGRWPLQRRVPDGGHLAEALHRRGVGGQIDAAMDGGVAAHR